ncbi:MAG: GAF domain-containing protein [Caldilineaceae bacterium]|nr:GAF domain-containing protein [Caldilineaceae bacterium]
MNEQTITVLFQQVLEEVEYLSQLTELTVRAPAEYPLARPSAAEPSLINARESLDVAQEQGVQRQLAEQQQKLQLRLKQLRQRMNQLELLKSITDHCDAHVQIVEVLDAGMNAVWQKAHLDFAVIVLGEAELGPYTYQGMRGVLDEWRYLGKICPFPLWGILARALLPRLDSDEPDYLLIQDIAATKRPGPEEFPWMPKSGSLMVLPLRTQERVIGAFLLGREQINGFVEQELCQDYHAIAHTTARILQVAQMRFELNQRSSQLLSLQLFTKSIAAVRNFDTLIDSMIEGIGETFGRVEVLVYMNDQLWSKEVAAYQELPAHVRSLLDWTMQAGQPIFYDPDDSTESLERFYYNESGRALVVPIIRNDRTLGVVQIVARETARHFEEGDLIVLRTIVNSVAIMLTGR